jgi:hypothetical protein
MSGVPTLTRICRWVIRHSYSGSSPSLAPQMRQNRIGAMQQSLDRLGCYENDDQPLHLLTKRDQICSE